MCVAVPMRIQRVDGSLATVTSAGVTLEVSLDLVGDVAPGDFVIVHAGYAIQRVPADEALATLAILERVAAS